MFDGCRSTVIAIDENNIVSLPEGAYSQFKLLENRAEPGAPSSESNFLVVPDVWDFDNVGVSRDIPSSLLGDLGDKDEFTFVYGDSSWKIKKCLKYLICADCDKGPYRFDMPGTRPSQHDEEKVMHLLSLRSLQIVRKN